MPVSKIIFLKHTLLTVLLLITILSIVYSQCFLLLFVYISPFREQPLEVPVNHPKFDEIVNVISGRIPGEIKLYRSPGRQKNRTEVIGKIFSKEMVSIAGRLVIKQPIEQTTQIYKLVENLNKKSFKQYTLGKGCGDFYPDLVLQNSSKDYVVLICLTCGEVIIFHDKNNYIFDLEDKIWFELREQLELTN